MSIAHQADDSTVRNVYTNETNIRDDEAVHIEAQGPRNEEEETEDELFEGVAMMKRYKFGHALSYLVWDIVLE
ncbi:hypothetical protein PG987_009455 [Apiospora arundinis]